MAIKILADNLGIYYNLLSQKHHLWVIKICLDELEEFRGGELIDLLDIVTN